jgi:indolepyruvate ferredoxin oxidoreductase beta subunit
MIAFLQSCVSRLTVVDAEQALREVGSPKVLNLILLGAAVHSGALGLEAGDLKDAVRRLIPEKFHELNFRALDYCS